MSPKLTKTLKQLLALSGSALTAFAVLLDVLRGRPLSVGPIQAGLLAAGALLLIVWAVWQFAVLRRWLGVFLPIVVGAAGILGAALILLNISGLFISLQHPQAVQGFRHAGKFRVVTLPAQETYAQTERLPAETEKAYVNRMVPLIFDGMIHYWELEENDRLRVPLYENWVMWAEAQWIDPSLRIYEYCDPYKAIERGVGVCSQYSLVLYQLLKDNGLTVRPYGLSGHVVAEALVDPANDEWWILDSDYGVVIPHSMAEVEQDPSLAEAVYREAGFEDFIIDLVVGIYEAEGNYPIDVPETGLCIREAQRYQLKWSVPILMLIPWFGLFVRRRLG